MATNQRNALNGLGGILDKMMNRNGQPAPTPTPAATPAPASTLPMPTVGTNALNTPQGQAVNAFYNTAMYQFPLQEGLDAVNASWAGRGALQSGAAMKAIEQYGANSAAGGLRDYYTLLGNQQGVGLGAASAQVGVAQGYGSQMANLGSNYASNNSALSQNYANNLSNLTGNFANQQGQYAQNVGNINSNGAVANANNSNAMWGGIGNALGGAAGYYAYGGR